MNPAPSPRRRGVATGFTLIELLTVIAIIGILAAIIIPTVGKVRESARGAQCVSNLRQIGAAIQLYADANRGFLPGPLLGGQGVEYNTFNGGSPGVLSKLIEPYLPSTSAVSATAKANELFRCPGWAAKATDANAKTTFLLNARPWATTHAEWSLFPFGDQNSVSDPVRGKPRNYNMLARFPLSRTWAFIDVDKELMYATNNTSSWRDQLIETPAHGNSRNALFYDWHVEKIPSAQNTPAL